METAGAPAGPSHLLIEVEQFLYREALLLDERRFRDWLDLLTDDIRYVMPTQLDRGQARTGRAEPTRAGDSAELAYLEDDRQTLEQRVERLESGMAWAEVPPSRTARIVANVLLDGGETADTVRARSVLLLHRHRNESEVEQFYARRVDRLRRVGESLKLAERRIVLAATALPGRNLALFF